VDRTPTRTSLGLTLKGSITGTHQRLADVVEAMCGVVRDFLCEVRAAVALLEVLNEVGLEEVMVSMSRSRYRAGGRVGQEMQSYGMAYKTVKLMESGEHVSGSVVCPIYRDRVWVTEIVGLIVVESHIASRI